MDDHTTDSASGRVWREWLERTFHAGQLPQIRRTVAGIADRCGADTDKTPALVLAAGELAAHAVNYGGGQGVVRLWREDDMMLCQVVDGGSDPDPLTDPAAGDAARLPAIRDLADSFNMTADSAATTMTIGIQL